MSGRRQDTLTLSITAHRHLRWLYALVLTYMSTDAVVTAPQAQ